MTNIIASLVVIALVASAAAYIIRAKKRGAKCIGCPAGGCCARSGAACCGCPSAQQGE